MQRWGSLAEWNDFFWDPGDGTDALAAEHYPNEFEGKPYTRHFVPMCEDGTPPPKGTTVCADGKPVIQCTDGTRPVFYYHQGTTDRWIIHVQNGGVTCSNRQTAVPGADCRVDADRLAFSTAWRHNPDTKTWEGLMDAEGSPFASYNLVVIDKCVGDRNLGDNTIIGHELYSDNLTCKGRGTAYFHGFRILKALLSHLTTWTDGSTLTPTSVIAIAANSNGANGLYMYIDRLADFIRSDGTNGLGLTGADVRGLASSFVRPAVEAENLINDPMGNIFSWNAYERTDFDDHIAAPSSTIGPLAANGLWYSTLAYYDGKEYEFSRDWGTILFDSDSPTRCASVPGPTSPMSSTPPRKSHANLGWT